MEDLKTKKKNIVKDAILDAAKEIIEEKGYDQLSIRGIASKIGYSVGSIYQYYQSKDALVVDLIKDYYQALMVTLHHETVDYDIEATIIKKFKAYCFYAYKQPAYYKIMMLSDNPIILDYTAILRTPSTPAMMMLSELLAELDKETNYSIKNPLETAQFLWTSVFGLLIKTIIENLDEADFNRFVDTQLKHLLNALKGDD